MGRGAGDGLGLGSKQFSLGNAERYQLGYNPFGAAQPAEPNYDSRPRQGPPPFQPLHINIQMDGAVFNPASRQQTPRGDIQLFQ